MPESKEMENLNNLKQWLHDRDILLFDRHLPFSNENTKATTIHLTSTDTWGVFMDLGRIKTSAELKSVLLHECGHCATGTTHAVSSPFDLVTRHEYKADKWAVKRALSADELDQAVADGYTELWSLAEHFGVTEDFMRKAVCWYTHGNLAADLYF